MKAEFNLVKFPIIFPVIYGAILYMFPSLEIYLIFFTILILAETHFGATWPFFLNTSNSNFISENKLKLISFPLIIIILSLIGFFYFKPTFLLIFFAANMFHVTRQSFGVCKLYTKDVNEIKIQENLIYIFNLLFFFVGFFRFYYPVINNDYLFTLNFVIIFLMISCFLFYYLKFKISDGLYTFITGVLIFYPICFVDNPVHAIIMGVTMHYTQYLYLTHKVFKGRSQNEIIKTPKYIYFFSILFYATIMSVLSLFGKSTNETLSILVVIPIIGQMLHFYLDSQLWKFSKEHNRKNTLRFLLSA